MTSVGGPPDLWVGVDLGTQSVRAVVVDSRGRIHGAGVAPLTSVRRGNAHEQDPDEWWGGVCTATREAMAAVERGDVRGISVDGTSGTILLVKNGRVASPALMYDDQRAGAWLDRVNDVGGALWRELGYQRMQTSWALPKLLWLTARHGAPGLRVSHQVDYINERLAGHATETDLSTALKTGADLLRERWPLEVLEELGLQGSLFPPLVRSGTRLGAVSQDASLATGIPKGTPIFAGTTDGCAAQLGAGALSPGAWNSVLGTTLIIKGVTKTLLKDPHGVVYSHKGPDGWWLPGGASSSGAGLISAQFGNENLRTLEQEAAIRGPVPSAFTYPLLGRGERFPFVAAEAEAFTVGPVHDTVDRFRAAMLGVALLERLCFTYLEELGAPVAGPLTMTGGATRNRTWNQLRADVLRRDVILPDNAEPALGMAILAAGASGKGLHGAATEMVRVREVVSPRSSSADALADVSLQFREELEGRGWLVPLRPVRAEGKLK